MNETNQLSLITIFACIAIGGLLIAAAIKNWDWFFDSNKYRRWVKLIGRKTVRIIIGITGLFICLSPAYIYFTQT